MPAELIETCADFFALREPDVLLAHLVFDALADTPTATARHYRMEFAHGLVRVTAVVDATEEVGFCRISVSTLPYSPWSVSLTHLSLPSPLNPDPGRRVFSRVPQGVVQLRLVDGDTQVKTDWFRV